MITSTRSLEFDAAHRLVLHPSKCGNLHGHRYKADITCRAPLGSNGMVIDFAQVKDIVGEWIDFELDHTAILNEKDVELIEVVRRVNKKPVHVVPFEPTAEHLAEYLLNKANDLLSKSQVVVVKVRLYETPNCWAEAALAPQERHG